MGLCLLWVFYTRCSTYLTEEIELTIKSGIANLYWFHGDLKKWPRAAVDQGVCDSLMNKRQIDGSKLLRRGAQQSKPDYHAQLKIIQGAFSKAKDLPPQERGYELEKIFADLMRANEIPVEEPFRIECPAARWYAPRKIDIRSLQF
jgi:hypothetical protein